MAPDLLRDARTSAGRGSIVADRRVSRWKTRESMLANGGFSRRRLFAIGGLICCEQEEAHVRDPWGRLYAHKIRVVTEARENLRDRLTHSAPPNAEPGVERQTSRPDSPDGRPHKGSLYWARGSESQAPPELRMREVKRIPPASRAVTVYAHKPTRSTDRSKEARAQ